jgi:hypothetical protein
MHPARSRPMQGVLFLKVYQVVTGFHVDAMIPPFSCGTGYLGTWKVWQVCLARVYGCCMGGVGVVGVGPKPRPWRSQGSEGIATYMTQWAFSPHTLLKLRTLSHCDPIESLKTCLGLWFLG